MSNRDKARYAANTPRWAQIAAHTVPLIVAPSSIWRILLAAGWAGVGHDGGGQPSMVGQFVYILFLSVLSESLALLSFGLVKPWGETLPRRLPMLGGRRVPVNAGVIPATAGAVLLALIAGYFFLDPILFHVHFTPGVGPKGTADSHLEVHGWAELLFAGCYAPLLAWPVLLGALTFAYRQRRRATSATPPVVVVDDAAAAAERVVGQAFARSQT